MSVINQMLIDLERRRASSTERNRIPNHVRALPGGQAETRSLMPVVVIAALILVAALAAVWWWMTRTPAVAVKPAQVPVAAVTPKKTAPPAQEAAEIIARRMSFELAHVPEMVSAEPKPSAPLTTAAVIARKPVPAPDSSPPVRVAPAKRTPAPEKTAAAPSVEISKQMREPTPRQKADAEYAKGVSALHQGRVGEARLAFESALQLAPAHHAARQALVGVLLEARQFAPAARRLQEGLEIAPEQYGFAMALARLQVEQGDLDAGVGTLAGSIEHASGSPEYAGFYAGLLQRQQKHAEAVQMFERALRVRGNSGIWLLGMGLSLDALGRGPEAQEAYRRAKAAGNLPGDLASFVDQRLR